MPRRSESRQTASETDVAPSLWPPVAPAIAFDADLERRIDALLERLSLDQKVGQIIQADHTQISAVDITTYHLGSVLNGGNSVPGGHKYATPEESIAEADAYWNASIDDVDGRTVIPVIWGTDAVHGHNNMVGATIFPHNIGLGAANNAELVEAIAAATAREVAATGLDWSFAPSLAVAQDPRWGRTFESYSDDPAIVANLAGAAVAGLQGRAGGDTFFEPGRVLACAKHFVGDGGTIKGIDQGDTPVGEDALETIHAPGYREALAAGVQTIMASFSSWRGDKLHGHHYLLTEVLKGKLGFDGFVVGDWNGHGQVPGCNNEQAAAAINAGVDMLMAPYSWEPLFQNTRAQVRAGVISMSRLDDAVRRILRVKWRAGLFQAPRPSERLLTQQPSDVLSRHEHRQLARQAVRESLVLLKNNDQALPIRPSSTVLVTGPAADDIGSQCGGWTLSWQGDGNTNRDFPNGQSILDGFRSALDAIGGRVVTQLNKADRPDVAVVVFGESPYAEFQGDIDHLGYEVEQTPNLDRLKELKGLGIPTVVVFLSGRPMWVNPHLNAADAFVAAWLPGSEGAGIADVLVADQDGRPNFDFVGRLPFRWPAFAVHPDDLSATPPAQFKVGYGLDYQAADESPGLLPIGSGLSQLGTTDRPAVVFVNGRAAGIWRVRDADRQVCGTFASPAAQIHTQRPVRVDYASHRRQDDALHIHWLEDGATLELELQVPLDSSGMDPHTTCLEMDLRCVTAAEAGPLTISLQEANGRGHSVRLSGGSPWLDGTWGRQQIPLSEFDLSARCLVHGLAFRSAVGTQIEIARLAVGRTRAQALA